MKQVPYSGPPNISGHLTKFSRLDDLATGIRASLHYGVHVIVPSDTITRQINPAHVLSCYFCKIHYNVVLSSIITSSKSSLSSTFPH
jgi:hypothetical protein